MTVATSHHSSLVLSHETQNDVVTTWISGETVDILVPLVRRTAQGTTVMRCETFADASKTRH